ncbi:MAG TPA: cell division/cell wall cluster transcriptional repressor MraZ [Candidatus Xenobia bacterium]
MANEAKRQFRGAYDHVLDDKARVIIPTKWRESLTEGIVLCRSLDGTHCIWGFAENDFTRFLEELDSSVPMGDAEGARQLRLLQSSISEVEMDKQGRILVSPLLRNHAMTPEGANVKFVGMTSRFEMWNPDRYEQGQQGVEPQELLNKYDSFKRSKAE